MNHFSAKTGHKKFHAIIGGTHLGFMTAHGQQLEKSMDAFKDFCEEIAQSTAQLALDFIDV